MTSLAEKLGLASVSSSGVLGLVLLCLLLAAALTLAVIARLRRRGRRVSGTTDLQRLFLGQHDRLLHLIAAGSAFDRCAAEFVNSLTREFGVIRLALYIEKRGRYLPMIWHGIDLPGIHRLFLAPGAQIVKELSAKRRPLRLSNIPSADMLGKILTEKLNLQLVFPVFSSRDLAAVVALTFDAQHKPEELSAYITVLCDLLGFALSGGGESRLSAGGRGRRALSGPNSDRAVSSLSAGTGRGRNVLQEANSLLLRIYNVGHLMETFLKLVHEYLGPTFAFVLYPEDRTGNLRTSFRTADVPQQADELELTSSSALLRMLTRRGSAQPMNALQSNLSGDETFALMLEIGSQIVVPITLPERRLALLVLGERAGRPEPYAAGDLGILNALCQTVALILENIYNFKRIEELSYTDSMTGLYNYRYFYKRLGEEVLRAKRFNRHLALVIFDIDEFKVFNDNYGHQGGDYILKQQGALLLETVRSIDVVSRYGGDEFCLIMPETDRAACEHFMDRLRQKILDHPFKNRFDNQVHHITVSLGGAIFPDDATRIDRLVYCADMALLAAKKSGRNRSSLYDSTAKTSLTE